MRILADENVDRPIVHWLREQGHDVVETVVTAPGASDSEIVQMSREQGRLLMAFDRDIGRIVLSQDAFHAGVIFLRLRGAGPELWKRFRQLWPSIRAVAPAHFVTVGNHRIRKRALPKESKS